jgi:hypothetical protein
MDREGAVTRDERTRETHLKAPVRDRSLTGLDSADFIDDCLRVHHRRSIKKLSAIDNVVLATNTRWELW